MKKVLVVIAMVSLFVLTGCDMKIYKGYTEVNYEELMQKVENKDSFVIVFGSSTCSACAKYKGIMENVIKKEQVQVFYIDLNSLSSEEYSKLNNKYMIEVTPTTVFIKNGVETSIFDRIEGAVSYSEIVKNLKKHGFMGD